ncbi:MAG: acyl-CoA dehydrogenase family protein [Pseudomonadota bacterium]
MAQDKPQLTPDWQTHTVENQPLPLINYNAYETDTALREAVRRYGAKDFETTIDQYGELAGSRIAELGFLANEHPPTLRTHDRYGHRIDQVDFHPAYHELMALGIGNGIASLTWSGKPGARIARSTLMYLHNQFEAGTMCPITMTHAAVPALQVQPDVASEWLPQVLSKDYDPAFKLASEKRGVTIGMAMTEKQGGSDVRANTTRARPIDGADAGQAYELVGHKWFCSAPMSDAFLSLAQTDEGLSCFLVPRFRPDGTSNAIRIQRLKHKLGNHSNASSEIEYTGAWAQCLGAPGRGVATIIRMVAETRLDCAIGSAALVRQAVAQAVDHCHQRSAFGQRLVDQPLMINVLGDLTIESEASMVFALDLAHRFEGAATDEQAALIARIATPIAKYWICKRAVSVINEAQECMGGAGYVEEFILPRLFREAPVNAIWEGSGNVQCLDVLRAIQRDSLVVEALLDWLTHHQGLAGMSRQVDRVHRILETPERAEAQARQLVESLALAIQAAALAEFGSPATSLYAESRLAGDHGYQLGTLSKSDDLKSLIERAHPRA